MRLADIWRYVVEGCLLSWSVNDTLPLFEQPVDIADIWVLLLLRASHAADIVLARMLVLILLIRVRYSPLTLFDRYLPVLSFSIKVDAGFELVPWMFIGLGQGFLHLLVQVTSLLLLTFLTQIFK